ncbi:MAG: GNAT family protein [Eubacteriales bacterium]|nr:GNAT family protein [Eubacteriales bacterium]
MNPYENCPVFENENYRLCLVSMEDAEDLLKVYSDEKAVPFFNSDNCHGDDFHYTTAERMREAVQFWEDSWRWRYFVRWAIRDKRAGEAIGTIELFHRESEDYFNHYGLLRLDLRSDYERAEQIEEILRLILKSAFELFDCEKIATKIPGDALERKCAMEKLGFAASEEKLIGGHDGKAYSDYYVLRMEAGREE